MDTNKLFEVLAEPQRRRMLDLLRVKERSVGELVALSSLSQPGVSKHLRLLREAGLVTIRRAGQTRLYRLDAKPLREIDDWFEPYRAYWSDKLDELERQLDEDDKGE